MLNTNELDWQGIKSDVTAGMGGNTKEGSTTGEKSVFLKVKAGFHHLRLVPAGNSLQRKFYLRIQQHPVKVPKDDGSGWVDRFVLCWSFVLNDLVQLGNPDKGGSPQLQKERSIVSYLGQVKAINQEEFSKYQTYGCPFCKAFNRLNEMGVDNETKNKFYPKEQYFFNAIWRKITFAGQPASGDDDVYIWRTSKTLASGMINTIQSMMEQGGINYIDVNTGKDVMIQATGEKLARRYPVCQFVDRGTPLNLGERIPHNLLDVLPASHFEYQKVVNYMKAAYGSLLQQYGHVIAGDQALTQAYANSQQAVNMANQVIAQNQNPSQFSAPSSIVQPQAPIQNTVHLHQTPPPIPNQPMYNQGDGTYVKDGTLYNASTHQPMF